jgi:RNA polymerase sigma-70 factor (ECF subfamily)
VSSHIPPELFDALRNGSTEAFESVYLAERGTIFSFLVRLSGDRDVASDLFQNTWLKLTRHAHTLRDDTDLRAWLLTVARNEYRSYCRAQMLDLSRLLVWRREQKESHEPDDGVDAQAMEAALKELSTADREVLLLLAAEGVSPSQAAQVLGLSQVALRKRVSRARKRLLDALGRLELTPGLPSKEM